LAGRVLWYCNVLSGHAVCNLPSSAEGSIQIDEVCRDLRVAVGQIIFALQQLGLCRDDIQEVDRPLRVTLPGGSLVLSGTWWVNSGAGFGPENTVPIPAGGFVRRIARTPHYDGVKKDANEAAVIGLFGIAPVQFELVDPAKPGWRKL
jgi:hypothetical protein